MNTMGMTTPPIKAAAPFADLPRRDYKVLYADPPWQYKTWSHRGQGKGASQHYDCMSAQAIRDLPVADIMAKDSVLFLWVVQPQLPEAMALLDAWGFTFKTVGYYWIKIKGGTDRLFYAGSDVRKGLGYHTRSGAEQCWIATRGNGYKRLSQGEEQVVFSPLREHSRKPDEIADSITALCGDVPRLEMFARQSRPGWDVWGNQTSKFDAPDSERNVAA